MSIRWVYISDQMIMRIFFESNMNTVSPQALFFLCKCEVYIECHSSQ